MSIQGISPRLPLYYDPKDGPYALIKIYKEAIAQDFKNLVEFKDRFHFEFPAELETQVERYLPFIKILNVDFSPNSDQPTLEDWQDPHVISIKIKYHILPLSVTDTLFINNI